MTHTENTKEEVRCENLGHVCRKTNTGQVLLECTFCNETLLLRTQKQLNTYAEARVREERDRCVKIIKEFPIDDWSSEEAIYEQIEEIVERILTPKDTK